jgi:anthranilate synthase component 1
MEIARFPDQAAFRKLAQHHNVIPVAARVLADTETPVSLMTKLYARRPPAFLLESVEGGEHWGRYSFLAVSAQYQVRIYRDEMEIGSGAGVCRQPHHRQPLRALRELMQRFKAAAMPGLPRFWGGLVGYLSYEMVSFLESIPNRLPPEQPLAQFMIPSDLLIFDNVDHTLTVVAIAFTKEGNDAVKAFSSASARIDDRLKQIAGPLGPSPSGKGRRFGELQARLAPAVYRKRVRTVKEHIRSGDIIQAVVSQPFCGPPPPELLALYRAQRFVNPSPYLFFLHLGETALIGSSPETMVRLENGRAFLRPIAGTRPRGESEREDRQLADELLSDEKERAEHLMLVDLGRNDLGRVAETGSVQVTDLMRVERYSHVMHLVSSVEADLGPHRDAWDLLAACFPAGTLSGAPKVRAMQIIAAMETRARGPYGGAVGYISFDGNMDLAITIRTAWVQDDQLTVRAGAGIVADSDPERERLETVDKARAIQKALRLLRPVSSGESAHDHHDR